MGLGGISMWQLLIILVIVILIFGTKRLKTLGGDLGGALKSFRGAMAEPDDDSDDVNEKKIAHDEADAQFDEEKAKDKEHS
jgi:sec-independent protein translocase protein TatA